MLTTTPGLDHVEVARALAPILDARGAETEAQRRVPAETIADLRESGLLQILQPEAYGGAAAPFDVMVEVITELAYGDASTAWVCANLFANTWLVSMFAKEAQDDVWATDPTAAICGTLAPTGKLEAVDGGYQLSGRWEFGSGCDAADWGLFSAIGPHPSTDGQPTRLILLVPREDFDIEDTWFTGGLRGTGSKDVSIAGAFVPQHRATTFAAVNDGRGPGRDVPGAGPLPRLPMFVTWTNAVAAVPVGAALRLVDEFVETTRMKLGAGAKASAGQAGPQLRLAESAAEVDAAMLLLRTNTCRLMELAERDEPITLEERSRIRRDEGFLVRLAVQAAERLAGAWGSHAIYDRAPVGRRLRDVQTAQAHHALVWDSPAESYARVRLGLEPNAKIL